MQIKFISPTAHGIMDWLTAGMLPMLPRVFGWDRKLTRLHDVAGCEIATLATLTDNPTGIVKVIPMRAHLMLDKLSGGLFLAAAALVDDEPPSTRCCMATTGAFLLVQGFCTRSDEQEARHRDSRARREPLRRYARETRPDIYATSGSQTRTRQAARR